MSEVKFEHVDHLTTPNFLQILELLFKKYFNFRPDHPRSNIPFAAASTMQEFVVEAPAPNTSSSSSRPGRVGEKTAAEIAEIYARDDFSDIFSADIGGDNGDGDDGNDSETSNSDKMISVSGRRDFGEIDFSSGKSIDQFDMSKTRTSDRNLAGWREQSQISQRNPIPVSSINFEFDNSKERSPKMIDSNSNKLSDNFERLADAVAYDDHHEKDSRLEKEEKKVENKKIENNTERTNVENKIESHSSTSVEASNVEQKIDTSLFDLSDDNFDTDAMTWRPLRLTPNGVFKTDVSEVLSTSNGDGDTIVTVLASDSWIPNGGPIMSERD